MNRFVGCILFVLSISTQLVFAQHEFMIVSDEARSNWIAEAETYLQSIVNPEDVGNKIEFYESNRMEDAVLAFRIDGQGYVRFGENDWVCIVTHSSHTDGAIGDVILARDQPGVIYEIKGHVCGGSVFFLGFNMAKPSNSAEFFTWFKSDRRDQWWTPRPSKDS
jgi:hypothetical protein